jgi:hypothetical protein
MSVREEASGKQTADAGPDNGNLHEQHHPSADPADTDSGLCAD